MSSGTDGARFGTFTTDEYKEMLKGHLTSHDVTCPDCKALLVLHSSKPLPDDVRVVFAKHVT
jgi:hypothetical protein